MMLLMRTTLTIDDALMAALKKKAFESGKPLKRVVNETLAAGLVETPTSRRQRFKTKTFNLGQPHSGFDLTKATRLAGELEDLELANKLELRR